MISSTQALDRIMEHLPDPGRTTLSPDRAVGHALAGEILAGENIPPFDNAAMDGYAVRSADIGPGGALLRVTGEIAAGDIPSGKIHDGEAQTIMTGAPLPDGADAVVQVEWTEPGNEGTVRVRKPVTPGMHIRRAGSDIPKGGMALADGHLLRPFELGVIASLGISFIEVYRKPVVALLSTGSELTTAGMVPGPGKIRESSSVTISALLRQAGCGVARLGIAPDRDEELRDRIRRGLTSDALITMGGVSAGKYDSLPRLLKEEGASVVFHHVNIKPGMPLLFAVAGRVPVFALPGNPVSAVVTFLEFVRPALRKMSGERTPALKTLVRARLGEDIPKKDSKRHFMRGCYTTRDGEGFVVPSGGQGSNMMSVLAAANCLMILPEEARTYRKSEYIDVELL